jgi:hypothetical protein
MTDRDAIDLLRRMRGLAEPNGQSVCMRELELRYRKESAVRVHFATLLRCTRNRSDAANCGR